MSMNISRRSFMKGAAAASLAVAASTMLTGCDMPDLGGIFGGTRTKTIKLKNGKTVNIALTGYSYDSWFYQARTEFKIVNNLSDDLKISDSTLGITGYTLVVGYDYYGDNGVVTGFDKDNSALIGQNIEATKDVTDKLTLNLKAKGEWSKVKLIFTVYKGNTAASDPVEFSFEN